MPDQNRPGKTTQPRKQRKRLYEADLKERRKQMSAHLSEDLMLEFDRRSMPVRQGDTVEIVRGDFAGHEGEVLTVDRKDREIEVDGVSNRRADGTQVPRPIHPSNVVITDLHLTDPKRRQALERKGVTVEEPEPEPEEPDEAEETSGTSEIAEEAAAGPDREPPEPEPEPETEEPAEPEAPTDEEPDEAGEPDSEPDETETEEAPEASGEPDANELDEPSGEDEPSPSDDEGEDVTSEEEAKDE